ncbi:hypothetical protein TNCV_991241 [Trichonephila clavipes]|nr:hypothetical protein TNCV_991241 [Trichonephila clavipes]
MAPGQIQPVQIPHVPEPVQIPVSQVPQPPVQIPRCPRTCDDSPRTTWAEPPVQIPDVPQPPVQISPELDWSRRMQSTSSCRSYLNLQTKNSSCFIRYPLFLMVISSHSWMNLKGSWLRNLWT